MLIAHKMKFTSNVEWQINMCKNISSKIEGGTPNQLMYRVTCLATRQNLGQLFSYASIFLILGN